MFLGFQSIKKRQHLVPVQSKNYKKDVGVFAIKQADEDALSTEIGIIEISRYVQHDTLEKTQQT